MIEALPDFLVDSSDRVVGKLKFPGDLKSGTLIDKPQDDTKLPTKSFERFTPTAPTAFGVSSSCLVDLTGEAENAGSPEPKRRQTFLRAKIDHKNKLFLVYLGYEFK